MVIAICDDEKSIRDAFKEVLEDEGHKTLSAKNSDELFKLCDLYDIDLVFLDILLGDEDGIEVLAKIKDLHTNINVIMITGHGTIDLAVRATKLGAFDFVSKPVSVDYIIQSVNKLKYVNDLKKENLRLKKGTFLKDEIIGDSPKIKKIKDLIKVVAPSDSKILITGENGTGKELVARMLHLLSDRKDNAFVEINCAAIPKDLIEAELFGFEKGSFTSAVEQKKGKFELASGGTLFLDEIGDMSIDTQVKVLRVIQDGRFTRIGGIETIETDVRIISATNKDLEEEIKKGNFREDLFYRLNVIPIQVPPLRDRNSDIPKLVDYFLSKITDGNKKEFTKEAFELLKTYDWPGNIRELKNIVERLNLLTEDKIITKDFINKIVFNNLETNMSINDKNLKQLKEDFEKKVIEQRLEQHNGNVTKTSESLGIERSNLHRKLKKYGINNDN